MQYPTEKHPFPSYMPDDCKYLIIGSFPPIKLTNKIIENIKIENLSVYYKNYDYNKRNKLGSQDIMFYYGSRDNLLWQKIISPLFEISINKKEDIIQFLKQYKVGITDLIETASRRIVKNKLSSRDSDLIIYKMREINEIIKETKLKTIYTTSEFVTKKLSELIEKKIDIITLPSPSKSASRRLGSNNEYKLFIKQKKVTNTIEYRLLKYKELLKNRIG